MFAKRLSLSLFALAVCASCGSSVSAPSVLESTLDGGRFQTVYTFRPSGHITNVALLFSGDGGWSDEMSDLARRLAGEGFLVGASTRPSTSNRSSRRSRATNARTPPATWRR